MSQESEDKPVTSAPKVDLSFRLYCRECKLWDPETVEDHAAGDMICKGCGVVLGDHIVDEHSEWRTFSNSDSNGADPNRVGGPANPLLKDAGLSTIISKTDNNASAANLSRWQNRGALESGDRSLLAAFKEISKMAERMTLPQTVRDQANELFKQMNEQKSMRGRSMDGIIAACLLIACREAGVSRTFKEICALANIDRKELYRCFKLICKVIEKNPTILTAADIMNRFCSNLGLSHHIYKAARYVANKAMEMGIVAGKSPISVAAASIYMISQLSDEKKTQKVIADAVGVSEVTIRNAYKDLRENGGKNLFPPDSPYLANISSLPAS